MAQHPFRTAPERALTPAQSCGERPGHPPEAGTLHTLHRSPRATSPINGGGRASKPHPAWKGPRVRIVIGREGTTESPRGPADERRQCIPGMTLSEPIQSRQTTLGLRPRSQLPGSDRGLASPSKSRQSLHLLRGSRSALRHEAHS